MLAIEGGGGLGEFIAWLQASGQDGGGNSTREWCSSFHDGCVCPA